MPEFLFINLAQKSFPIMKESHRSRLLIWMYSYFMIISPCTRSLFPWCVQYMCLCPRLLIKSAIVHLSTASLWLGETLQNPRPMIPSSCVFLTKSYKQCSGSVVEMMHTVVDMFCKSINKVITKVDCYPQCLHCECR